MIILVKSLHLLALVLALGSGVARLVLAGAILRDPASRPTLAPLLGRFTGFIHGGLSLLWVTGIWLYVSGYLGADLGWAFHAKMTAVFLLTAIAIMSWLRARSGRPFPLPFARTLGRIMVASGAAAVVFATLAFN